MKNFFFAISALLISPLAYNAQDADCVIDLVIEAYAEYLTLGSVDFPEGATLNWSVNGEMMNNGSDVIELPLGLFINGPVEVCVSFVSDACPDGVEICETVDLNDLIGGGDCLDPDLIDPNTACFALWAPVCGCNNVTYGNECEATNYGGVTSWTEGECSGGGGVCPDVLGAMQQTADPCNWIFEIEGSGDGVEVNWDFGDGTGETAGHIADHHYAEDGVYIATAIYLDSLCEGVVLSTVILVEGCGTIQEDCTIELDYEFFEGYVIFEAYNYPDSVVLYWTYNGELYAEGTNTIEVSEPNPFPEDGVTICVGYETPSCPEGVFACEFFEMEDDCELELEGSFVDNTGYFEAYVNIENAYLTWTINGDIVAEGNDFYQVIDSDYPDGFLLCVSYSTEECDFVEACEFFDNPAGGGGCPEQIEVIFPKWDMCSWAFEVDTLWSDIGTPPSWIEVIWNFGDGSVQTGTNFWASNMYDTDGVYVVFVQYSDSNCPDGTELSVVIQVEGCGEGDCIDQDQIDNDIYCTEEYDPVCGCDDVTYSNECYAYYYGGVTSWVQGECTDDVSDIDGKPSWSVFPVPTSDFVTFKGLYVGSHFLKIYDNQGRLVMEESVSNGETLSLKELINGWYTMQIVGVESSAKRVVVQR